MNDHDQVAAYALDALDDDERHTFERHLAECEQCTAELEALTPVASALAFATDAPAPPPALRERLLAAASAEREKVVPLHRRWTVPLLPAVAAAAACLAIGLGLWAANREGGSTIEAQTIAVQALPEAKRMGLDARGTLIVNRDGEAALVVQGLPGAPAASTYQAWVIEDGTPASAGVFAADGQTIVLLSRRVRPGDTVAVTLEPGSGSVQPQGPMVLRSETV